MVGALKSTRRCVLGGTRERLGFPESDGCAGTLPNAVNTGGTWLGRGTVGCRSQFISRLCNPKNTAVIQNCDLWN